MVAVRFTDLDVAVAHAWQSREVSDTMRGKVPSTWWGVTQFVLDPKYFGSECGKNIKPGDVVEVDLDAAYCSTYLPYLFHLGRFLKNGNHLLRPCVEANYQWLDVPAKIQTTLRDGGTKTLGDLAVALHKEYPACFPAALYGPKVLDARGDGKLQSAPAQNLARLLFDYWDNDEYRYAVIEKSGAFTWQDYYSKPWTLPTTATADSKPHQIKRVLGIPPRVINVPVASGSQTRRLPPETNSKIRAHLDTMRSAIAAIRQVQEALLHESELRMRFIAMYRAFERTLWAIAQKPDNFDTATPVSQEAAALQQEIESKLSQTPLTQFSTDRTDLESQVARMLGIVETADETMRTAGQTLASKLLNDEEFAEDLRDWLDRAARKGKSAHADTVQVWAELCQVLEDATEAMKVVRGPDAEALNDVLEDAIDNLPSELPSIDDVKSAIQDEDKPVRIVAALLAHGGRTVLATFGNFQSPMSLSVAWVGYVTDFATYRQLRGMPTLVRGTLDELTRQTFRRLRHLIPPEKRPVWAELEELFLQRKYDKARLFGQNLHDEATSPLQKNDLGDVVRGSAQSSLVLKKALAVIQLVSFLYSVVEMQNALHTKDEKDITYWANAFGATAACVGQGMQLTTMTIETVYHAEVVINSAFSGALMRANVWIMTITSFIAACQYLILWAAEIRKGEVASAIVFGGLAATNAALFALGAIGIYQLSSLSAAAVAGVFSGAVFLVVMAIVVAINVACLVIAAEMKGPAAPIATLRAMWKSLRGSPVFFFLAQDSSVGSRLKALEELLKNAPNFEHAPHQAFIIVELERVGLKPAIIRGVTGFSQLPPDISLARRMFNASPVGI